MSEKSSTRLPPEKIREAIRVIHSEISAAFSKPGANQSTALERRIELRVIRSLCRHDLEPYYFVGHQRCTICGITGFKLDGRLG